jgi:hypothetical protein
MAAPNGQSFQTVSNRSEDNGFILIGKHYQTKYIRQVRMYEPHHTKQAFKMYDNLTLKK